MSFLKPKAPKSDNQSYGLISKTYSPMLGQGNESTNFIAQLLGVGGGGSAADGFQSYKDMAGYAPALRDMQRGVTATGAASGLLRSGATANRLLERGAELDQQMFGNYLQQLAGLSGLGLQAGQLISGSGSRSTGGGPSTAGAIASTIGGIASIFSDRRCKRDIVHLTDMEDGLGVYSFKYLWDDERRIGVMADEVADYRPWALGPTVGGYSTVNYAEL